MEKLRVNRTTALGIAISRAIKYKKDILAPQNYEITNYEFEIDKYNTAVGSVITDLNCVVDESGILKCHVQIANDPSLNEMVLKKISEEGKNAQIALRDSVDSYIKIFSEMDNKYLAQRVIDLKDVYQNILQKLQNMESKGLSNIDESGIIVASELAPSDMTNINPKKVKGIVTEVGTSTGHVSLMAKTLNIPFLVGVKGVLSKVKQGDTLIIDSEKGELIIEPDSETLEIYRNKFKEFQLKKDKLRELMYLPSKTQDGKIIPVNINISGTSDLDQIDEELEISVGLFRTEFLFMKKGKLPSVEEQFEAYKEVCQRIKGYVTIRTLDVGGDKEIDYLEIPKEENPFLGMRGIRYSLKKTDIFKDQIRAILMSSKYGQIKIMLPMVSKIEEIIESKKIIEECKEELREKNIKFDENIEIGLMMETPASVMESEFFGKHADFFSIGTNDLIQYILCVDRGNDNISELYDPFDPSVIHAIQKTIESGKKNSLTVSLCGDMANEEKIVRLLISIGLDVFSVPYYMYTIVKDIIMSSNYEKCLSYSEEIRKASTRSEILEIVEKINGN